MNIKTIVKVMNFHALLRVDSARRAADQYALLEGEVARMIDIIANNRNFILDKWIMLPPKDAPRMRLYIGSDLGFCGTVNAFVNGLLEDESPENTVITVGRKVHRTDLVDLSLTREEFDTRYGEIEQRLAEAVRRRKYSGIDLCYDRYVNMTHIEPTTTTIFPIHLERDELEGYTEDFSVEGSDINTLMENLLITYLNYEVKSAAVSAFAAENILRQSATNESMKKIDEMETEALWARRKELNQQASKKVIDSYIKKRRVRS